MKASLILPLCLLSSPLLAAGVYEIDRSQWEKPPAATAAQKPATQRSTHATTHNNTSKPAASTASQPATPAADSTAPKGDVAQTCQPGHACSELQ